MKKTFLALLLLVLSSRIFSQDAGVSLIKTWTNNYEIQNPTGFGLYFAIPLGKLKIKFEYMSATNERRYHGIIYGNFFVDPEDFIYDSIVSKSTFRATGISLQLPGLFELLNNQLNVGAGISFDKFKRDRIGLYSLKKFSLSENKFGLFYMVSVSRQNIFGVPLKLELLFKHKGLMEGNYATDSDQPFVAAIDVKEFQLNIAYVF